MVRLMTLLAQNNTASNDRLICARVTGSHVERSRFDLVKSRNLVLPWWTDQHHNKHVKAVRSCRDSSVFAPYIQADIVFLYANHA